MNLKKNPKKDLSLKRGLYFVIGLLFLLAIIYIALEWKTFSDNDGYDLGYSGTNLNQIQLLSRTPDLLFSYLE